MTVNPSDVNSAATPALLYITNDDQEENDKPGEAKQE